MAGRTKEVRTIMFSVEGKNVVTHKLPFDANDPIGKLKLQKFLARGFTYDDPRGRGRADEPQVIVTQEVDLAKPTAGDSPIETAAEISAPQPVVVVIPEKEPVPIKKWCNMNAQERRAYQEKRKHGQAAKKGGANA